MSAYWAVSAALPRCAGVFPFNCCLGACWQRSCSAPARHDLLSHVDLDVCGRPFPVHRCFRCEAPAPPAAAGDAAGTGMCPPQRFMARLLATVNLLHQRHVIVLNDIAWCAALALVQLPRAPGLRQHLQQRAARWPLAHAASGLAAGPALEPARCLAAAGLAPTVLEPYSLGHRRAIYSAQCWLRRVQGSEGEALVIFSTLSSRDRLAIPVYHTAPPSSVLVESGALQMVGSTVGAVAPVRLLVAPRCLHRPAAAGWCCCGRAGVGDEAAYYCPAPSARGRSARLNSLSPSSYGKLDAPASPTATTHTTASISPQCPNSNSTHKGTPAH
jgi:hypothetical protein